MKYIFVFGDKQRSDETETIASAVGRLASDRGLVPTLLAVDAHSFSDTSYNLSPSEHNEIYVLNDGTEADFTLGFFERSNGIVLSSDNYLAAADLHNKGSGCSSAASNTVIYPDDGSSGVDFFSNRLKRLSRLPVIRRNKEAMRPTVIIVDLPYLPELIGGASGTMLVHSIMDFIRLSRSEDVLLINHENSLRQQTEVDGEVTSRISTLCFHYGISLPTIVHHGLGASRTGQPNVAEDVSKFLSKPPSCSQFHQTAMGNGIENGTRSNSGRDSATSIIPRLPRITAAVNRGRINRLESKTTIGILTELDDWSSAYHSIRYALIHGGLRHSIHVNIKCIPLLSGCSDDVSRPDRIQEQLAASLANIDGILLPGGFTSDYMEEKLAFIRHARENNIPFLGICLGFQLATIEFARNVLGISQATSEEFSPSGGAHIVKRLPSISCSNTGRDILLGAYPVEYRHGSVYGVRHGIQRFRHRYALSNELVPFMENHGMKFFGKSTEQRTVLFQLAAHTFFTGAQYHPEFISAEGEVDPLFSGFVKASAEASPPTK